MTFFEYLLEQPFLFNLSQIPFTRRKFARIQAHSDISKVRRVLDVGCGPGTNAPHFQHAYYLGIDINERYIEIAKRRFHRDFLAADVTKYEVQPGESFDFVLLNSFLHHIDTPAVQRILAQISTLLSPDGFVHSIELVLPERRGVPYVFAKRDRGNFPRPLSEWRSLFEEHFQTVVLEPFSILHFGLPIMDLVYFKGRTR